jgi:hypothetical protein
LPTSALTTKEEEERLTFLLLLFARTTTLFLKLVAAAKEEEDEANMFLFLFLLKKVRTFFLFSTTKMSYVVFYKRLCAFSLSLKNETDVTARALCELRRRLVVVVSFAAGIMLHFFLSFSLFSKSERTIR